MVTTVIFSFSAIVALILPALYFLRAPKEGSFAYWALMAAALVTSLSSTFIQFGSAAHISLSSAIWVTISASALSFLTLTLISPLSRRLTPLVMPYLAALGLLALIWHAFPGQETQTSEQLGNWVLFHVAISVITYALATLAALCALSAFIVERALKQKRPNTLSRLLPSVMDSEMLLVRLLISAEAVLAMGILSGVGLSLMESGEIISLEHKTVFSLLAFVAIAALLYAQQKSGMRGKQATRIVLVAYLLLSLGFLGVRFVTDVMMP